jgi:hypothetical protein
MPDDENEDEIFGSKNVISLASPEPPKRDLVLKLNLGLFKTQVHLRNTKILREGKEQISPRLYLQVNQRCLEKL